MEICDERRRALAGASGLARVPIVASPSFPITSLTIVRRRPSMLVTPSAWGSAWASADKRVMIW
jgi:hypothetical protein